MCGNEQSKQPCRENFPHIRNIVANSNPSNDRLPVDILIGANYYWSIINNHVIKTIDGFIALDAKVGWILREPVNNPSVNVNNLVLFSHVMEIQSEFIGTNNVLKHDLNMV